MDGFRSNARVAGVLFLVAMVASLVGGALVESGVLYPGIALELVNAIAVIGIAAALWPVLWRAHPATSIGYFGLRVIEAMLCVLAALAAVMGSGALRDTLVGIGVPLFFAIGAVLLYAMLFRSALVPRYVAIWGLVGAAGVLVNVLVANPSMQPLLVLPIIANEIFLGIYLIARGFRSPRLNPEARAWVDSGGAARQATGCPFQSIALQRPSAR